ncbi:putative quinol monooxygenase [Paenibacillus lemnae]|uniref:Antibiotic biosynthesis monooxygenase n=1 Tax=Paenibacillus lemnae TaxID=1330551 RepID=A0A848M1C9_PAELE|nr:putative quinol monooxygenase [Paenibacillus lemnae]NMO94346.1 antibiotic biosynthesis monooxygenase [Paenibacillus lemnae]
MSAITIVAIMKAKTGNAQQLRGIMESMIRPSRGESGCVEYVLHESTDDPEQFVFYETWQDEAAFQSHIESPHYKQYRLDIEPLIQSREVHRLRKLTS